MMIDRNLKGAHALRDHTGIMICPDNHRCENYSICSENPVDEGSYYCDCDASPLSDEQKFAGLYCEHEATIYCTPRDSKVFHSFCTNGGQCISMVEDWEEHRGCLCEPGYVGNHCQFIEGSDVPNWMGDQNYGRETPTPYSGGGGGLNVGGIVGLFFLALAFVVLSCFLASKKSLFSIGGKCKEDVAPDDDGDFDAYDSDSTPPLEVETLPKELPKELPKGYKMSADLHLDSDGGVLKEALDEKQEAIDQKQEAESDWSRRQESDWLDNEEGEDGMVGEAQIV